MIPFFVLIVALSRNQLVDLEFSHVKLEKCHVEQAHARSEDLFVYASCVNVGRGCS